ncbi:uncharacterized protein G2W53_027715 [Senna tora]|uniref:Uncharacterized protein n=1 Tax=Senna tora TaxID=362788 RepID=A0A834WGA3_9FABA|nr:uncharacterized protein G2W53_027715 [Senna tora]
MPLPSSLFPSSENRLSPSSAIPFFSDQNLISLSSESLVFGVYAAADKFFDTVSGDLGLDLCLRS